MGLSDRIVNALTSMIRMEDKVSALSEAAKAHQQKIEEMTGRLIRLETQLEMLSQAAGVRHARMPPGPETPRLPTRTD